MGAALSLDDRGKCAIDFLLSNAPSSISEYELPPLRMKVDSALPPECTKDVVPSPIDSPSAARITARAPVLAEDRNEVPGSADALDAAAAAVAAVAAALAD